MELWKTIKSHGKVMELRKSHTDKSSPSIRSLALISFASQVSCIHSNTAPLLCASQNPFFWISSAINPVIFSGIPGKVFVNFNVDNIVIWVVCSKTLRNIPIDPEFSIWGITINSLNRIDEDISDIFWAAGIFLCLDQLLPDSHHCSGCVPP